MPRPQANGSSGSADASATPAAIPTLVSRADDTTAGRPHACDHGEGRAHSPSGATLTTTRSAASRRATSTGSLALRIDSSAAIGRWIPCVPTRSGPGAAPRRSRRAVRRTRRPVCRERTERFDGVVDRPAPVGVDPNPRRPAPHVANRRHAVQVVGQRLAALGDLDLGRRAPSNRATTAGTSAAGTAGTVALTGTRSRTGPATRHTRLDADASQRADSSSPYSRNGPNSPQPAGPRRSAPRGRQPAEPDPHRQPHDVRRVLKLLDTRAGPARRLSSPT